MSSNKQDQAAKAQAPKVKVTITREGGHRHAGQKYEKGAKVEVTEADAVIIVDKLKVGERVQKEA